MLFADEFKNSPASDLYSAMRNLVRSKEVETVGGFVCLLSNREQEFRHSAYCDMLFDWPNDTPLSYELDYNDSVDFGSTGENEEYSISQISTGYENFNCVCFYVLRAKTAYLFYPTKTIIADACKVITDLEPINITDRLLDTMKIDLGWLAFVASAPENGKTTSFRQDSPDVKNGNQLGMMVHCNTFPPSGVQRNLPVLEWKIPS